MNNSYRKEIIRFFLACSFFTYIPVPSKVFDSYLPKFEESLKYLGLIGILIGIFHYFLLVQLLEIFSIEIGVILSLLLCVLVTGALHEDGLADTSDGFLGSFDREKCLLIMKDPQIGTYGALSLIFIVATKYLTLVELVSSDRLSVIVFAHALSRMGILLVMFRMPYARTKSTSKIGQNIRAIGKLDILVSFVPTILFLAFCGNVSYILLCIVQMIFLLIWRSLIRWKIQAYTGDTLGAYQQLSEVLSYVFMSMRVL